MRMHVIVMIMVTEAVTCSLARASSSSKRFWEPGHTRKTRSIVDRRS